MDLVGEIWGYGSRPSSPLIIRAQPSSPLDVEVRVATKRWIQWFHEIWYWLGLMGVKKVDA